MWCANCDGYFDTDDYQNCNACDNCDTKPVRMYRTSSFSFCYAYEAKHPTPNPELYEGMLIYFRLSKSKETKYTEAKVKWIKGDKAKIELLDGSERMIPTDLKRCKILKNTGLSSFNPPPPETIGEAEG